MDFGMGKSQNSMILENVGSFRRTSITKFILVCLFTINEYLDIDIGSLMF